MVWWQYASCEFWRLVVAATVMLKQLLFVAPGRNLCPNDYVASIDMACQLHHSSCLQHGMVLVMERLLFVEAMAGGHSTVVGSRFTLHDQSLHGQSCGWGLPS